MTLLLCTLFPVMASHSSATNASSNKAVLTQQQANVLIIYTGGTIGMQPGSDGSLKPCKGFLTDMIPKMDELTRPGMPIATGQSARSIRHTSRALKGSNVACQCLSSRSFLIPATWARKTG